MKYNHTFDRGDAMKAIQQGTHLKTQMLRVDADFADALRKEAAASGIKVTEVTRHLYESIYAPTAKK